MATKEGLLAYQTKYPIHAAIRARDEFGAIQAMKQAIQRGLSPTNFRDNVTDFENAYKNNGRRQAGVNPLYLAIDYKLNEVVKFLLDPELETDLYLVQYIDGSMYETSALHVAARTGSTSLLSMLVKARCDINCKDFEGNTPLHIASWFSKNSVVKKLIELGANKRIYNSYKITPFEKAAMNNNSS